MFQHDMGVSPHFHLYITVYLNQRYGNFWIGHHGPVTWLLRSPDLMLLDIFLWSLNERDDVPDQNTREKGILA
jgi:hypothetical protein